jgi:hypothetical protein
MLGKCVTTVTFALLVAVGSSGTVSSANRSLQFPHFRMQEIDRSLKVGYAVLLVDLNDDGRKDIVVVDTTRVVWFENPSWKMRTIIEGQTKPDNVCIAAYDIDGDGQLDLALGADWRPFNTKDGGTLQWLKRGKTIDDPWTLYPIDTEPTVHRIRFADLDGDGRARLIVAPLMGRNSTKEKNWGDAPVRLLSYKIPPDPTRDRWVPDVIDRSLHVVHNFEATSFSERGRIDLITASYDGVHLFTRSMMDTWSRKQLSVGNQEKPRSNRGASEVKVGRFKNGRQFIATIEPWHGNQVVVYTPPDPLSPPPLASGEGGERWLWKRNVIDDQLKWGHAVWCADLDGDGGDEIIVGVRDAFSDRVRYGVNIYKANNETGTIWQKHMLDNGGVAVEDLACADLDGDGRIDIVAVGRATGNVRIYWNEGFRE